MKTANTESAVEVGNLNPRSWWAMRWWLRLYVLLWIFEGVPRKWIPGAGQPLYFFRDMVTVVALLVILMWGVGRHRIRRLHIALGAATVIAAVGCFQAIAGRLTESVLVIGLDTYAVPVLIVGLLAVCPRDLNLLSDLRRIVLWAAPLEALIVVLQVTSPPTSFVNKVSAADNIGLFTANGIVRGSGTFTSPSGLSPYIGLVLALTIAAALRTEGRMRLPVVIQLVSGVGVVALAGSRGAILGAAVVLVAAVLYALTSKNRQFRSAVRFILVAVGTIGSVELASRLYPAVFGAFGTRITEAATSEDSTARLLDNAFGYFHTGVLSWAGDGMGSHSRAGGAAGSAQPWIEAELARWVGDLGLIGLALVVLRQVFAVALLLAAFRVSRRCADPEVWLVVAALFPSLIYGAITAPSSSAGFAMTAFAIIWLAWPSRDRPQPSPSGGVVPSAQAWPREPHPPVAVRGLA